MNITKWVATLAGGCLVTVSVWAGGVYLDQIKADADYMANQVEVHHQNALDIRDAMVDQQEIYVKDFRTFEEIISQANAEIDKANKETKEASEYVKNLREQVEQIQTVEIPEVIDCKDIRQGVMPSIEGNEPSLTNPEHTHSNSCYEEVLCSKNTNPSHYNHQGHKSICDCYEGKVIFQEKVCGF